MVKSIFHINLNSIQKKYKQNAIGGIIDSPFIIFDSIIMFTNDIIEIKKNHKIQDTV